MQHTPRARLALRFCKVLFTVLNPHCEWSRAPFFTLRIVVET